MSEKYLKASDVAKKFDVSSYTVKGWIKKKLLPNAKLEKSIAGSVWLIPETDLEGFEKPKTGRPPKKKKQEKPCN